MKIKYLVITLAAFHFISGLTLAIPTIGSISPLPTTSVPVTACQTVGDFTVPCTSYGLGYQQACLDAGGDPTKCQNNGTAATQECLEAALTPNGGIQ